MRVENVPGWRKPPTTRLPIARRARHGSGGRFARVEDAALLTGRGRFIDDLGVRPGTLHAAILRSPHAHADIVAIDASAAQTRAGRRGGSDGRGRQGR